jgi:hypothetical protein
MLVRLTVEFDLANSADIEDTEMRVYDSLR